jgi:hypothetical protein
LEQLLRKDLRKPSAFVFSDSRTHDDIIFKGTFVPDAGVSETASFSSTFQGHKSMPGPSDSSSSAQGLPSAENSAYPDTKGRESHVGVPGGPGGKKKLNHYTVLVPYKSYVSASIQG